MPRVCVACRGQRLESISGELRYEYEAAGVTDTWRYRWLRCASCELSMLDPEPSLALMQSFVVRAAASQFGLPPQPQASALRMAAPLARLRELGSSLALLRARSGNAFSVLSLCLALQLPKDAVILDLACGDGRWLSLMAAAGFRRLHGHMVAGEPERVTSLRQRGVVVSEGSFLSQEFPSASYDCIRIHDGLASLPEPAATVRQCLRMLKPSGVLLVHAPATRARWSCMARAHAAKPQDAPCHVYHHTVEALRALLSAAGFRDLQALARSEPRALGVVFDRMRQQAGKSAYPAIVRLILRPAYVLTSLWGDQRDWLTLVAREPAAVRLRPSTNGHSRGLRHALFTRS